MSHDLRWTKWRTSTRRSIRLTSEHSAHLGSFHSVHLPVIRLTSEVSVPCTRHEVSYSSEVCRMHAGAIILSGAPEGLITEPPFLHTRSVISLHQRWPRVSARDGNGRGEPNVNTEIDHTNKKIMVKFFIRKQ